jgi:4-hydroxy-2-oxoheptanedioate aldolase
MATSPSSLLATATASIRRSIRGGAGVRPSCGSWITLADPETARIFARTSGFPWLCLDMEHCAADLRDAVAVFGAVADAGVAPLVRVPRGTHENIKRVLDAGAFGVVAPMVETAEEARAIVNACKYPPLGTRSFGPGGHWLAARSSTQEEYFATANAHTLVILQTESPLGLKNADEIYAVPGVDCILVGPRDLRGHLTRGEGREPAGAPVTEAEFEAALAEARRAARAAGVPIGIHAPTVEEAEKRAREGFSFFTVGSDRTFLMQEAQRVAQACAAIGGGEEGGAGAGATPTLSLY